MDTTPWGDLISWATQGIGLTWWVEPLHDGRIKVTIDEVVVGGSPRRASAHTRPLLGRMPSEEVIEAITHAVRKVMSK